MYEKPILELYMKRKNTIHKKPFTPTVFGKVRLEKRKFFGSHVSKK